MPAIFPTEPPESRSPATELSAAEPSQRGRLSRRTLLSGSLAIAAAGGSFGCRQSPTTTSESAAPRRRDVPLRIQWVGTEAEADALKRAWQAVSSQPLEVTVEELHRDQAAEMTQRLVESAPHRDVMIYPLAAMASLASADAIIRLGEEELQSIEEAHGTLLPALRHGAASYAGEVLSIPLGSRLPALLAVEPPPELKSWGEYDRWVDELDGSAAEPLAAGWAGTMFLWRSAATLQRSWLFDQQTLRPLIDSETYVDVLRQMKQTASRYRNGRQTPEQIWNRLASGELRGGIGFPAGMPDSAGAVHIADLPAPGGSRNLMFDPFSPVASLSAGCRQTAAAKLFLQWIAGGEGSGTVRRQVPAMTITRERPIGASIGPADAAAGEQDLAGGYPSWLRSRLSTALTRPGLQLLQAGQYHAALDEQVGRCLDGEAGPEEALATAAERWQKITDRIGVEQQRRCWMRAQGMRAAG